MTGFDRQKKNMTLEQDISDARQLCKAQQELKYKVQLYCWLEKKGTRQRVDRKKHDQEMKLELKELYDSLDSSLEESYNLLLRQRLLMVGDDMEVMKLIMIFLPDTSGSSVVTQTINWNPRHLKRSNLVRIWIIW
jgi:hypothetical protein